MRIKRILLYSGAIIIAGVIVTPLLWMFMTSIKTPAEIVSYPPVLIPKHPSLDAYVYVATKWPILRFIFNSVFVSSMSTLGCVFLSSLGGFAFAKYRFKGNTLLFTLILCTAMIPWQVTIIPLYIMFRYIGWIDTYWALIVPGLQSAYGIFLMRQFMKTVPDELLDSARIDGCSEFGLYLHVMLPVCKTGLGALAILIFIWNWSSFVLPLIMINKLEMKTVPVAYSLVTDFYGEIIEHYQMAGAILLMTPALIYYLILQRHLIEGITLTGLKK